MDTCQPFARRAPKGNDSMKNENKIHIVGIAGGSGTRLWPLSRKRRPKQFLNLPGRESTLLQATYQRVSGLADARSWWLICNELHVDGACESLPMLNETQILAEPMGKNTAPAILWAALELEARGSQRISWSFFRQTRMFKMRKPGMMLYRKRLPRLNRSHCDPRD